MQELSISTIQQKLQEFIYENFPLAKGKGISIKENLLESGTVDSMGLLIIIGFLESDYNLFISDEEVVMENFESIAAISSFVLTKRNNGNQQ